LPSEYRTVFLLQYISDINLHQQITASTNTMEAYNGFSKFFFFGDDGIISENEPDEQEKRIKYNGLIKEDVATLSPYLTRHIKRFGDYIIDLDNILNDIDMNISIPIKQEEAT